MSRPKTPDPDEAPPSAAALVAQMAEMFPDVNWTGRDGPKKALFLWAVQQTGSMNAGHRVAGVARTVGWQWRVRDRALQAAAERCLQMASERLVDALWTRATDGIEKGVYYMGKQVATEKEYSDTAAIFLLKSLQRRIFGNHAVIEQQSDPALQALYASWQQARAEAEQRAGIERGTDAPSEPVEAEVDALDPEPSAPVPRVPQGTGGHTGDTFALLDRVNGRRAGHNHQEE